MSPRRSSLLVTGGAGFIGANFVHYWRQAHPADSLVVLDALTYAGNRMSLAGVDDTPRFTFVHGSILDQDLIESLLHKYRIDTVVHFAAESHVDRSIVGPDPFIETNVIGTHNLLKACRRAWLDEGTVPSHHFHHVSTDEVYGSLGPSDPAFREDHPYSPNSPYAASKAASDHLVRAYAHTYGLAVTTTNCSNNYGPYHFPEKLIPLAIVNILDGRPLPIYGDGGQVRDWLFVTDHCRAIDFVLERGKHNETYNVGAGSECANIDLVRSLCATADRVFKADAMLSRRFPHCPAAAGGASETLITFIADRPGHDRRYAIDSRKIQKLGFAPRVALAEGLELALRWYLDHEPWWRSVMDGSYRDWMSRQYGSGLPG